MTIPSPTELGFVGACLVAVFGFVIAMLKLFVDYIKDRDKQFLDALAECSREREAQNLAVTSILESISHSVKELAEMIARRDADIAEMKEKMDARRKSFLA